jgi:hypothetical protein
MLSIEQRCGDSGVAQKAPAVRVGSRPAGRPVVARAPAVPEARSDALAGQLARAVAQRSGVADHARTALLQRWPAERATAHEMSLERITGKDKQTKAGIFAALRRKHTDDAHEVIEDLDVSNVWGGLKSDITGTGDDHDVRIDRQNPTQTHSNIQIQTNGTSISIATVLVSDALARAKPGALHHHIRAAFKASLRDGMQWEVYDR